VAGEDHATATRGSQCVASPHAAIQCTDKTPAAATSAWTGGQPYTASRPNNRTRASARAASRSPASKTAPAAASLAQAEEFRDRTPDPRRV